MRYEEIINTASQFINNEEIKKDGLILVYELDPERHKDLDEHLFYKSGIDKYYDFEHRDVIELEVQGIKFNFIRDDKQLTVEDKEEEEENA